MASSIAAEKSGLNLRAKRWGLWLGKGELRRLTIRGLTRPRLVAQRSVAASLSKQQYQRLRRRGCTGGKSARLRLGASQQMNMAGE